MSGTSSKPACEAFSMEPTGAYTNEGYVDQEKEAANQTSPPTPRQPGELEEDEDFADFDGPVCCLKALKGMQTCKRLVYQQRVAIGRVIGTVFLLLYLGYTGYALYRQWGTEAATPLLVLLVIVLLWLTGQPRRWAVVKVVATVEACCQGAKGDRVATILRRLFYGVAVAGMAVFLGVEVAPVRPANFLCLLGMVIILVVALLLSSGPQHINWHTVFWGLALQFYLAVVMLRTEAGLAAFRWLGARIETLLGSTDKGSAFIFGKDTYTLHPFVFKLMPIVLFSNALIIIGYHVGAVQALIGSLGRFLAFCLDTQPVESISAAANIFLGLSESSIFVRPYLASMCDSELFAVMTGGFASISGSIMGIIISLGIPAEHLLSASVLSAPAALAMAKVMCPWRRSDSKALQQDPYRLDIGQPRNLLEAMEAGTHVGVAMVVGIAANILIFIALLDVIDGSCIWFGIQVGVEDLSFTRIMSYLFCPVMYVFGVDTEDLLILSRLLGIRIMLTPLISYMEVSAIIANSNAFNDYRLTTNGSWHYEGDDLVLDAWNKTLEGGVMNERSVVLSTYILCGFCNIGGIAVSIGAFSALVPQRTKDVIRHVMPAWIAGNLACFLTGCVTGLIYV